jgi:NAD(P)-dependent dehydrogenase (short-subunit alcohol dehydrogenase family)
MNSILITGCNRGLGLGLVKSLLKLEQSPKYIFATCRNLEKADVSKLLTFANWSHYKCN